MWCQMWTETAKVGDLLVKRSKPRKDQSKYAIIMDKKATNRPTYGAALIDTSRWEYKLWLPDSKRDIWVQDVELRAIWIKP